LVSIFLTLAIALYSLAGAAAGALATALLGWLADVFDMAQNPHIAGYLLSAAVTVSYVGCAPFFYLTACEYEKFLKKAEELDDKSEKLVVKDEDNTQNG